MADSKSGRELEPEVIHKGPPFARKFFALFGIGTGVDDESEE